MASVTNYTGNAGLGAGANPDIPVVAPNANLDVINQAVTGMRNQDYERNLKLYDQKIKDRDTLREMLAKGITASGEIDEQDRGIYDEAEKKAIDAFHAIKDLNDQGAIEKFYKESTRLSDIVTHAQERNMSLKQLQAERAKETLPYKQKEIDDFIAMQRGKGFDSRIDPFQRQFSFSTDPIMKLYSTASKSYDSEDGLYHYDDVVGDYATTLKNTQSRYLENGEVAEDMRQLFDKFQRTSPQQQKAALDAMDAQIDRYNSETGNNVAHVLREEIKDANGRVVGVALQEQIPDFAAKFALSNQNQFSTQAKTFNDKVGTYKVNMQKAATDAWYKQQKLGIDRQKAGAYSANVASQIRAREKGDEQDKFIVDIWNKNLTSQPLITTVPTKDGKGVGGKGVMFAPIKASRSLPIMNLDGKPLKPIGAVPVWSKYDEKGQPAKDAKVLYYEKGEYKPRYFFQGKEMTVGDAQMLYNVYRGRYKQKNKTNYDKSFEDFVKEGIQNQDFKVVLTGADGSVDEDVSKAALLMLSNQKTGKGEMGVIDMPADEYIPEQ